MTAIMLRLALLALVALCTWLVVRVVRASIERRRQQVLASTPDQEPAIAVAGTGSPVRILAFSSADCSQCHRLQTPALQRLKAQLGDSIAVIDIDAPTSRELTDRYKVLTVPTTVILDATGKVHAVNYGFANTQRLTSQVAPLLATVSRSY